jgi:hypothetical protein
MKQTHKTDRKSKYNRFIRSGWSRINEEVSTASYLTVWRIWKVINGKTYAAQLALGHLEIELSGRQIPAIMLKLLKQKLEVMIP